MFLGFKLCEDWVRLFEREVGSNKSKFLCEVGLRSGHLRDFKVEHQRDKF